MTQARDFLLHVESSREARAALSQLTPNDAAGVERIARAAGFECTALEVARELHASKGRELADADLEQVAGGFSFSLGALAPTAQYSAAWGYAAVTSLPTAW